MIHCKISKNHFILFFALLISSYFSIGFYHPDEQYYTLDFAFYKLGLLKNIETWEYRTLIRPWTLSYIFLGIMTPFKLLGISNPFHLAFICRFISGILGFFTIIFFSKTFKNFLPKEKRASFLLLFTSFWPFIFMSVRTSTDHWSSCFFIIGLTFILKDKVIKKKNLLYAGLLLGLAFSIRHQTGILSLTLGLWVLFSKKINLKDWIKYFSISILTGVLIGIGLDIIGYNQLTFTPYNYLKQNLINDKISSFGVMPWWGYFLLLIKKLHLWSLPLLIGTSLYIIKKPKGILSLLILSYFIFHAFIGHKELRFIYPLLFISLYMTLKYFPIERFKKMTSFFFISNSLFLLFIMFKPAYTPMKFYQFLYTFQGNKPLTLYIFKDKTGKYPRLEMKVYKRSNLRIKKFDSSLVENKFTTFTTKYHDLEDINKKYQCLNKYISYPKWILTLNFFGWRERSNIWAISSCRKRAS